MNAATGGPSTARGGLLAQVWRRRIVFMSVAVLTLGIVVATMKWLPVHYSAGGSVIVAEQEAASANNAAAWVQKLGDPADLESQLLVIRSSRMLRLALASPGVVDAVQVECRSVVDPPGLSVRKYLHNAAECTKLVPGSQALLSWVEPRYVVASAGRSRVINISYQSEVAAVAQLMANALITAYLEDQRSATAQNREATAAWLWKEVSQLDLQLQQEDAQIQQFRRENGLVRGQLAPISSERLSVASQQLSAAQAARLDAAARLQEIGTDAGNTRAAMELRSVADIKQQLAAAAAATAAAAQTLGPNHPSLAALRQQQAALQARLSAEAGNIAVSAQRSYAAASTQVASLSAEQQKLVTAVGSATDSEAQVASMVRATEIKRALYVDLYKRASELETETRVLTGSTRLVSLAELPTLPFFPKTTPFLAAGITLATMLGLAAAFLRDMSDRSVRGAGGLEAMAEVPVLSQIPRVTAGPLAGSGLARLHLSRATPGITAVLQAAARSPTVQDALRSLHARLVLAGYGSRKRTLLVTSAAPGDGKTFTALALARQVAASGRSVLVVECDLRRPTFARALGLPAGPGLTGVLRGRATPVEAMMQAGPETLFAIPAGTPCAESTELLMGDAMGRLLRWAEYFDLVILDSPPSEVMMDARMLAQRVDGVLCCARWGQTRLLDAAAAVRGLRDCGGDVLGIVMGAIDAAEYRLYDTRPVPVSAYGLAT